MFRQYNVILSKRANIISRIRHFFLKKNILEVETPIATKYTVTDAYIIPFSIASKKNFNLITWLITSPEYHMKRLLSRDIGPIYQICHVFRDEEIGDLHNLEFTMLEWYQPFYNMFDMMDMVSKFFQVIFDVQHCKYISYRNIFLDMLSIDPFNTSINELSNILKKIYHQHLIKNKDTIINLLNLIFTIAIQPKIGLKYPIFIYHYPADQAMLARINRTNFNCADRFEVFFKGIELGNGFCELIDAQEQKKRFNIDNLYRKKKQLSTRSIDNRFLSALSNKYMPHCSGIAIGLDRVIMIICHVKSIKDVLSFSSQDC